MSTAFLTRLKEHKLVQWALAYLAAGWLLLQMLDLRGQNFDWPRTLFRAATMLLAIGCLAAPVLAWYHGEKRGQRVSGVELLILSALLRLAGVGVRRLQSPRRAWMAPLHREMIAQPLPILHLLWQANEGCRLAGSLRCAPRQPGFPGEPALPHSASTSGVGRALAGALPFPRHRS